MHAMKASAKPIPISSLLFCMKWKPGERAAFTGFFTSDNFHCPPDDDKCRQNTECDKKTLLETVRHSPSRTMRNLENLASLQTSSGT
jgi:hypothetical protein